jgi:hypothetical protein
MIGDVNSFDDQCPSVFFYLSPSFGVKFAFTSRNFARFQRAAKGAGQSAGGGRHHIIQSCGMGIVYLGVDSVVFGNFGMNTEHNRRFHLGQIRPTQWAFHPFNFDI